MVKVIAVGVVCLCFIRVNVAALGSWGININVEPVAGKVPVAVVQVQLQIIIIKEPSMVWETVRALVASRASREVVLLALMGYQPVRVQRR